MNKLERKLKKRLYNKSKKAFFIRKENEVNTIKLMSFIKKNRSHK